MGELAPQKNMKLGENILKIKIKFKIGLIYSDFFQDQKDERSVKNGY